MLRINSSKMKTRERKKIICKKNIRKKATNEQMIYVVECDCSYFSWRKTILETVCINQHQRLKLKSKESTSTRRKRQRNKNATKEHEHEIAGYKPVTKITKRREEEDEKKKIKTKNCELSPSHLLSSCKSYAHRIPFVCARWIHRFYIFL